MHRTPILPCAAPWRRLCARRWMVSAAVLPGRPPYPCPGAGWALAACGFSPCRQPAMVEQQCRSRIAWPGCHTLACCTPPIPALSTPQVHPSLLAPHCSLHHHRTWIPPAVPSHTAREWPSSRPPDLLQLLRALYLAPPAAPGCGRDCTGCPTQPACLNGRPKTEKPCCWTSTGPKPKDGFCYQYTESDNSCGAW